MWLPVVNLFFSPFLPTVILACGGGTCAGCIARQPGRLLLLRWNTNLTPLIDMNRSAVDRMAYRANSPPMVLCLSVNVKAKCACSFSQWNISQVSRNQRKTESARARSRIVYKYTLSQGLMFLQHMSTESLISTALHYISS